LNNVALCAVGVPPVSAEVVRQSIKAFDWIEAKGAMRCREENQSPDQPGYGAAGFPWDGTAEYQNVTS